MMRRRSVGLLVLTLGVGCIVALVYYYTGGRGPVEETVQAESTVFDDGAAKPKELRSSGVATRPERAAQTDQKTVLPDSPYHEEPGDESASHADELAHQIEQLLDELAGMQSDSEMRVALMKLRMLARDSFLSDELRADMQLALQPVTWHPSASIAELAASIAEELETGLGDQASELPQSAAEAGLSEPAPGDQATTGEQLDTSRIAELTQTLLYDPNAGQRRRALDELSIFRGEAVLSALGTALQDEDAGNRYAAVQKISVQAGADREGYARLLLQQALNDPSERVAALAEAELLALETRGSAKTANEPVAPNAP